MVIKRIIENWREASRDDLRRSVRPYFKGDKCKHSSYRSGSETYLVVNHGGTVLEFSLELGLLSVSIDGVDARKSPALNVEVREELKQILSSKDLLRSERNRRVAQLISDNLD
jgi:hypothetical protein